MYPVLFQWGPFSLHTYGVMIAMGFFVGSGLMIYLGVKKEGLSQKKLIDLCFWSFFWAFIGARLLYVLTRWDVEFAAHPLKIFQIWKGGLVFYGGLIGGLLSFVIYSYRQKLSLWTLFDISAAPLSLAQMFGRLGCFSAGCCWGKSCPLNYPLAVRFTNPLSVAPHNVPLHPTQLYEAVFLFFLFLFLMKLYQKRSFVGQVGGAYFVLYAVGRFIIEFFRGDEIRGFWGPFSTSQWIAFFMVILGLWILWIRRRSVVHQ